MADWRDIDRLLLELERQPGLAKGTVEDISGAITTSPYLTSLMTSAIDLGTLRRLEVSNRTNESGHYEQSTGTISLSAVVLSPVNDSDRLDMIAGTLGHETGHALMALSARNSLNTFIGGLDAAIKESVQYGDPVVDATQKAKQYMATSRQDEAFAELVSMNSVASRVRNTSERWSESELLSRLEPTTACVRDGKLEPGITLDVHGLQRTGGHISSPAVEAVAICHFDKSADSLGIRGAANYSDYYAAYAVGAGAALLKERSAATAAVLPRLGYDLAALGTDAAKLEGAGVDLGGQGKTFGFVDTSHGQRREVEIRQLGPAQHQPDVPLDWARSKDQVSADNPAHHDHSTYSRIHDWVKGTGNWNEVESHNVSAALYKQQTEHELVKRVDQVTGGLGKDGAHNVFAVYAPFGDKGPLFHAHVDGRVAAQEPAQHSLQQAEALQQNQARQQTLEQTQQQTRQQEQGPRMAH